MTPGLVEKLKAARAALDAAIRESEAPAKKAGDWRKRCHIVRQADGNYDVVSPCKGYWLWDGEWNAVALGESCVGSYANERVARMVLRACKTPPPGEGGR